MQKPKHSTMMRNRLSSWLPLILWMLVIFAFSSLPSTPSTEIFWQDFLIKKSAHITEFFILTLLLYRGFRSEGYNKPKIFYIIFVISTIYAFSDEIHQSFTPGRQSTIRDVVIDTIGTSLAIYFILNLDDLSKRIPKLSVVSKYINHE